MPRARSVRNPDGIWINTNVFREEALQFMKNGYYCGDATGSTDWYNYWKEQRQRCIDGYTVGGVRIPGNFYFYLNFCPISKVEDQTQAISTKIEGFPDFWDGDFNYFWVRDIARYGIASRLLKPKQFTEYRGLTVAQRVKKDVELFKTLQLMCTIEDDQLSGGHNLMVGKSRRKGYSYKAASIAACNYFTKPKSLTLLNAYEKRFLYPQGLYSMTKSYINFVNEHTAWGQPADVTDTKEHIRASYMTLYKGLAIEKGLKTEVMAITCKDNEDPNRGKDAEDVLIDEAGAFGKPGLLKGLYKATRDVVRAGAITTGLITIFGTSGDMEKGTADYADMFFRPRAFNLLAFKNTWDEKAEETSCGYFHPYNWNTEGFYDKKGNSDFKGAKDYELKIREEMVQNGAISSDMQGHLQENPLGPNEAFANVSVNNFPVAELKSRLAYVRANDIQRKTGICVNFIYKEGKIEAKMILSGKAEPITSYHNLPKNQRGCVVIYEQPISNAPKGLYTIGYDPIRQDTGTSLAAVIVMKGTMKGAFTKECVVAEFVGRKATPELNDEIAMNLAIYYQTQVMHENEITSVKNYFRQRKRLDLLAVQPENVIKSNIKNSKVARIFGCHMTGKLKDAGERYIIGMLNYVIDYNDEGEPIKALERINSVRLLEELIAFDRTGNFDLISALIMCLFQVQEGSLNTVYDVETKNRKVEKLTSMISKLYKKNN